MASQEAVDWRAEWSEAERIAAESSEAAALPHYDRAIKGLLDENGYRLPESGRLADFDVMQVAEGLDPEPPAMYLEAHAILNMIEVEGRPAVAETVALAVKSYREVREILTEES